MASKRYFINKLSDAVEATVNIPKDLLKTRTLNYIQQITGCHGLTADDCDGGLYVGLSGVSYMCYSISQHPDFTDRRQEFLDKSEHFLKYALHDAKQPRNRKMMSAFVLGAAGTLAVAAVLKNALGKDQEARSYLQEFVAIADNCIDRDYLGCGSDEILVGRAGYLSGVLFLEKNLGFKVLPEDKVSALCDAIIESGLHYSKKHRSPCPLMYAYYKTEYIGAAHGLSGILQMLLSFPSFLDKNPEAEGLVKETVDFLLSTQTASGNFPSAMDEVERPRSEAHELVHWCHGAPGVVYLMAKAYIRWKDEKYLRSCLRCGDLVWSKGLLKKGPGICHGIAGSGYVFLLLYRLTGDNKHLHRALQFAEFLYSDEFKRANTPDRPLSLYEGIAGTVCFLADLMQPEKAHFPFFEVF